jgi:succinyl-CoA synthetase beta subunit
MMVCKEGGMDIEEVSAKNPVKFSSKPEECNHLGASKYF